MTPTAGKLNRRVTYQDLTDGAPNALGQVPDVWSTVATVWAEVRSPSGRELLNAGQYTAIVTDVITVRRARGWFPKPTGRFLVSSPVYDATPRTLNVVSATDPDSGREWVVCMCLEQTTPAAAD